MIKLLLLLYFTVASHCSAATLVVALPQKMGMLTNTDIRKKLETFMVFSDDWRVTEERGAKVAHARSPAIAAQQSASKFRVRFSNYRFGSSGTGNITFVDGFSEKGTQVKLASTTDKEGFHFILRYGNVSIENSDEYSTNAVERLERNLGRIADICSALVHEEDIPNRFSKRIDPQIRFAPLRQAGLYRVYGYVNPKMEGVIRIRVFNELNHEVGSLKADRTLEYVGWSADPSECFYFESELTLDGNGHEEIFRVDVVVEPRFESTIYSTQARLKTWVR